MRFTIMAGLLLLVTPVLAEDAPKSPPRTADMTTKIMDGGVPMKDMFYAVAGDCSKCEDLTIGEAIYHAVLRQPKGDNRTAEVIWSEAMYVASIKGETAVALNSRQADVMVSALVRVYATMGEFGMTVLTQTVPLIDPNKKPPAVQ